MNRWRFTFRKNEVTEKRLAFSFEMLPPDSSASFTLNSLI